MDDLISRQAAIYALDGEIEITGRTNAEAVKGYVRLVKDRLERLPSAQPERKTGQLKYESAYNWFRCNVCRKIYPSEFMQYFDSCQYQPGFNFCPNCGADMRGEQE